MEDFVEIDKEKIDELRNTYNETINSKSIYKIIGGNKMKSYKGYEIEKQKIDEIVEERIEDVHKQYKNIETILSEVAIDGYEEGFADGEDIAIKTCIRLLEYDKDVLIGIFFGTYAEDNEKNPIKSILSLIDPDTINLKLDAFDKACEEDKKEVSAILKALKRDENGKIHTVKLDEKKGDYEVKLIPQVRAVAKRISEYSCEELLDIFGVAGLPEYRFSQYLMDYSVTQINNKLDTYDSKIRMKAEHAKLSNEMLEKFAKCLAEGCSKEDIERMLKEIVNI